MDIALITGSAGLIGSEAVNFFSNRFDAIIGIDNNLRQYFFGEEASTRWNQLRLERDMPHYTHKDVDIREVAELEKIFREYGRDIKLVLHTAAQPSHDWAAKEPFTDFTVNANGTLNLLAGDRPAAQGIHPAGGFDAQCWPRRHPDDAAGTGLGFSFRSQDVSCGNPYQPLACQDRQTV